MANKTFSILDGAVTVDGEKIFPRMIYWETQQGSSGNITTISPYLNSRTDSLGIPDLGFNMLFCKLGNVSSSWTNADTIVTAAQTNGYYVIAEPADNTPITNFDDYASHLATHFVNNHGYAGALCLYERDENQKTSTGYTLRTKIIESFDDCGDIFARDLAGGGYRTSSPTDKNTSYGSGVADRTTPTFPPTSPPTTVSTSRVSGRKSRANLKFAHHLAKNKVAATSAFSRLTFGTHQWLLDNGNGVGYSAYVDDGPNAAAGNPAPGMYRFVGYTPDLWAIQSYPENITATPPTRFLRPYAEMREFLELHGAHAITTTCFMTLIPVYSGYGLPTVVQHRCMFFQAIAGGARGIGWYNYPYMVANDAQTVPIRQDIARCNNFLKLRALNLSGTIRDGDSYEKIVLNGYLEWLTVAGTMGVLPASSPALSRSYTAVQATSIRYNNTMLVVVFNAHSVGVWTNLTIDTRDGTKKVPSQPSDLRNRSNLKVANAGIWANSSVPTLGADKRTITIPSIAPYETIVLQLDLTDGNVTPPDPDVYPTSRVTMATTTANKAAANTEALSLYADAGNTFDEKAYTTPTTYGAAKSYYVADSRLNNVQSAGVKASSLVTYYQFENARTGRLLDTNSDFLHSQIGEVLEYSDIRKDLTLTQLTPTDSANCLGWWNFGAQSKLINPPTEVADNGDNVTKVKPWYAGGDFDQAIGANMPVCSTKAINKLGAIQFKDGDTFMEWVGGKGIAKNRAGLTISVVFRADNTTSDQNIIHITTPTTSATRAAIRLITGGKIMLLARALDGDAVSFFQTATTPIVAGNWYHVVGTFNFSTKTGEIFVNNASILSSTFSNMTAGNTSNTDSISGPTIGREASALRFYNGLMANLAIYNGVMSGGNLTTLHALFTSMYGI